MTVLSPARVSTKQFTYSPTSRTFHAEVSELPGFGRVYDDAADEGFTMVSHRTGREVVFVVTDIARDSEGDLQFWTLTSLDNRFSAIVFND